MKIYGHSGDCDQVVYLFYGTLYPLPLYSHEKSTGV